MTAPGATVTLALAFGAGSLISALCRRLGIPAVLPLLLVGIALGESGAGLINPADLKDVFRTLIALAIGLLVFEGGLHLDRRELSHAPGAVVGLLTAGALVTWLGSAAAAYWLGGIDWPVALVLGAILIVTGPTVIQPILRSVKLTPRLHSILTAEAILIDPIAVVIAVAAGEFALVYYAGQVDTEQMLQPASLIYRFGLPLLSGVGVGLTGGLIGILLLRWLRQANAKNSAPLNLLTMSVCMTCMGLGEMVAPEGGLVAVTIASVMMANARAVAASDIRVFKDQIATLLVGMLFVLLGSQFQVSRLTQITYEQLCVVAAVLLIRVPNVWISTLATAVSWREKAFMSFFAPRGIVAVSVATLLSGQLIALSSSNGFGGNAAALQADARSLELIIFALVVVSVTFATVSAWPMAWALKVRADPPSAVLVVGAHGLGRRTAKVLTELSVPVVMLDSNSKRIEMARQDGLQAVMGDATDTEFLGELARSREIGWVLAWTGNDDVDRVLTRWSIQLGQNRVAWVPNFGSEQMVSPALALNYLEDALKRGSADLLPTPQVRPGDRVILRLDMNKQPPRLSGLDAGEKPISPAKPNQSELALVLRPKQDKPH